MVKTDQTSNAVVLIQFIEGNAKQRKNNLNSNLRKLYVLNYFFFAIDWGNMHSIGWGKTHL